VLTYRISDVAALLGVSDDTVRRLADGGELPASRDERGHRIVAGPDLARFLKERVGGPDDAPIASASARNRIRGIVTEVVVDTVMAKVEIQAGPHRIVSLMSREAVESLGLEPGVIAIASVKATNVVVGIPEGGPAPTA
jgi:molybdopterin-binding protein